MKFYFKKKVQPTQEGEEPTILLGSSFETDKVVATTINDDGHMVIWLDITVDEMIPTSAKYRNTGQGKKEFVKYDKYEKVRTPLMITLTETEDIDNYLKLTSGPARSQHSI